MSSRIIGKRLKVLRESRSISQETVAELIQIKDRQTISAIETGHRRMSVDELIRAADVFDVSVDYFTDPFRLEGEGQFSWRSNGAEPSEIKECEARASSWIALFRVLRKRLNVEQPLFRHSLSLSKQSSFDDASTVGERICSEYALGEIPAKQLSGFMEEHLNFLVLNVDMGASISGAACRVSDLDVVLVNQNDSEGERNLTLGQELFHLLTWDSIPPRYIEDVLASPRSRASMLGDTFVGAILMPSSSLPRYGSWADLSSGQLITKLNSTAIELGVTSQALKKRLVTLGLLNRKVAESVSDRSLRKSVGDTARKEVPPRFSKRFMEVIGQAVDLGHISVRRTANVLDVNIEDLHDLFMTYSVNCEIGL